MKLSAFLFVILFACSSLEAAEIHLRISIQEGFDKLKAVQEVQDFVQQSLKTEKIQVSFYPLPFARSSSLVNRGDLDGELMRASNLVEDYPNIVLFPKALVFVVYSIVYKTNRKFDEKFLQKYKGIVLLNSATTRDELRRRGLRVEEVGSIDQGLQMVRSGRVDYIILADPVIDSIKLIDASKFKDLRQGEEKFQRIPLYLCLNKKHKDLIPKIEKALSKGYSQFSKKYKMVPDLLNPSL